MAAHHPSSEPLDQTDPHHDEHHHGHVILPTFTLVSVLALLLFFTVLTVALSRIEIWAGTTFLVEIPNWVNIGIVLSIATIKSIMVGMYFMQLKYDHPINSIIFLFCLFAFGLFLSFTMIDLGTRGHIYAYKGVERQLGGMGINISEQNAGIAPALSTGGVPIALYWREVEIERLSEKYGVEEGTRRYWEKYELSHGYRPAVAEARRIPSDASISRGRTGLTTGLFDETPPEQPVRRRGWRGARDVAEPPPARHNVGGAGH
jgi:cytochrome c oxidase subunit IV